jgi:hypothetical protein
MPDCRKRCGGPCGRAAKKAIKRGTDPIDFVAQDNLLRGLSLVQTQVAALKAGLDDAVLLVGNHVFSVSRTVYALMKTDAAKAKMQSQKALMKQRFTAKKTSQPATDTAIRQ